MNLPLFFPPPEYVLDLSEASADAQTLRSLCADAGVPCRASGVWTERPVVVVPGERYRIEAEAGDYGRVKIEVPAWLSLVDQKRHALGALAYGLMDLVARESLRGAAWARPANPRGRRSSGVALSTKERQRRYRARLADKSPEADTGG